MAFLKVIDRSQDEEHPFIINLDAINAIEMEEIAGEYYISGLDIWVNKEDLDRILAIIQPL